MNVYQYHHAEGAIAKVKEITSITVNEKEMLALKPNTFLEITPEVKVGKHPHYTGFRVISKG